ncbi:MAG: beta-glucosidase [Chloroflexi bacterium]|nr:MAG: beta-glucosidase [Chloroflexota bacterium]
MAEELVFPEGFVWGAATAAYQIEGAVAEDGRGPSIWDTFTHTPGTISDGTTGDVACDHYHRWREDIDLMRRLHLNAYRFSVAWPRVLPQGRGRVNQPGLDFYSRLVDGLLEAGITPYLTLYHFDLPQALQDDGGGWLRRSIVDDFAAFVDVVSRTLGDRVRHWMTLNEPWSFGMLGYLEGEDAPGLRLDLQSALTVAHHALLAHGAAVDILRANAPGSQVGIVLDVNHVAPASDAPEDIAAARRYDGIQNRMYLDALFHGRYPEDMLTLVGEAAPPVAPGDLRQISRPIDFLGVNLYRRSLVAAGDTLPPINWRRVNPPGEYTLMGWEVSPNALYDTLLDVHQRYAPPTIYVTENGAAFEDTLAGDGRVHDDRRVAYFRNHLAQAACVIAAGVPLHGYFAWSLLDNFEWAYGYERRFGVVHVDFATQQRTIKDSGYLLAEVARTNRIAT